MAEELIAFASKQEMLAKSMVTVGAGRAFFRADLLRQLRRLIDQQMARREVT